MAHGYSTLQHWEQWLAHHQLGHSLLNEEQQLLTQSLSQYHGKHAVLIGVQHQYTLFKFTHTTYCSLFSPLTKKDNYLHTVETALDELPLLSGSIDLVILPHILELVDNPRQLLIESCRIVKPEGYIAIMGFNPYSFWGIKKMLFKNNKIPWSLPIISPQTLKKWLYLADFRLTKQLSSLFRPPVSSDCLYKKLKFMDSLGKFCCPSLGGIYLVIAQAQVFPLTPIRLKWKQQLNELPLPTPLPGQIARQSKYTLRLSRSSATSVQVSSRVYT